MIHAPNNLLIIQSFKEILGAFFLAVIIFIYPIKTNANEPEALGEIIFEIANSTSNFTQEELVGKLLDSLIDRRELQGLISNRGDLSLRISNRLAQKTSSISSGAKLGAGLIGSILVDIIADEVTDNIVRDHDGTTTGRALAIAKAASFNVLLKQSYIYATSGGNQISVVVGQASLLLDIAKKDIEAFKEARSARDLANRAALRAEMYDILADYYESFVFEESGILRAQQMGQIFERFAQLRARYGDEYWDYFNALENYVKESLRVARLEYVQSQIPTNGSNEIDANDDIQDENTVDIVAGLNPDNGTDTDDTTDPDDPTTPTDPVEPTDPTPPTDPVDPTPPTETTHYLLGSSAYTTNSEGNLSFGTKIEYIGSLGSSGSFPLLAAGRLNASDTDDGEIETSYLSFVYWGSAVVRDDPRILNGQNQPPFRDIHRWYYGATTSPSVIENRTGTATYGGEIRGDLRFTELDRMAYGVVTGDIELTFNFSSGDTDARGVVNVAAPSGNATNVFTVSDIQVSTENTGQSSYVNFSGTDYVVDGVAQIGTFNGQFFGDGSEVAGTMSYTFNSEGTLTSLSDVTAVFVADENHTVSFGDAFDTPTVDVIYWSQANRKTISQAFQNPGWQWLIYNDEFVPTSTGRILESDEVTRVSSSSEVVTFDTGTDTLGDYEFTKWGSWLKPQAHYSDAANQTRAFWVGGQATHPSQMPQVGTASYSGEIIGTQAGTNAASPDQPILNGTINFDVSFSDQNISGSYAFDNWHSGNIPQVDITSTSDTVGFSGQMIHDNSANQGTINGTFFGPNGSEIAGHWQDGLCGNVCSGGVFRAQQ